MKLSIGNRLLAALLLSFIGVAAVSLELVRWKLLDNFSTYPAADDSRQLAKVVDWLSTQYRQDKNWSFIPTENAQRKVWLRNALDVGSASPTLGYRIGLLDGNRRYLAGVMANRLIVTFASIDRIETPLHVDGDTVGYLVYAKPQNPDDGLAIAFLIDQQNTLFVIAAFGIVLSVLVATFLAATFRKPIRQLVKGAQRLEQGHFDARLNSRRNDELGQLAQTFDHLAARLDDTEQRRRQWVADTSHELRTPLSILGGQIEALQDGVRTATPENLALLRRQVQALTKLVDELYDLARADVGQLQYAKHAVDVWRIVEDELASFSEKIKTAKLTSAIGAAPNVSIVVCDADRIRQVVRNLLENCVRYTAAGGRLEIDGRTVGSELRIVIDDSAPAVDAASLSRLGERFFRIDGSRNRASGGAGLGLALCRKIIEAHEGRLEFSPSPLGGLRASVVLPLTS